jgi:hypothetical protein
MDLGTLPGFVVPILFGRADGVAGTPALTRHERRSLLRALRRGPEVWLVELRLLYRRLWLDGESVEANINIGC